MPTPEEVRLRELAQAAAVSAGADGGPAPAEAQDYYDSPAYASNRAAAKTAASQQNRYNAQTGEGYTTLPGVAQAYRSAAGISSLPEGSEGWWQDVNAAESKLGYTPAWASDAGLATRRSPEAVKAALDKHAQGKGDVPAWAMDNYTASLPGYGPMMQGLVQSMLPQGAPAPGAGGAVGGGAAPGSMRLGGSGTAAGYGALGTGAGAGGLPNAAGASSSLRDLQMGATQGLAGLMNRDTTASRKAIQDALYAGQAESINAAADHERQVMLEGTFGRGVGSSSILVDLAGRGEQERSDALARALREAYTQAGSEDRADLASALGVQQGAFNAATGGLQAEANVNLANLAREQQASQFAQNLSFQGTENSANRAATANQFAQNLALQQEQLGQQASQFGSNQQFVGSENQLNRDAAAAQAKAQNDQAMALLAQQQTFAGGENASQRELAKYLAEEQQAATAALAAQGQAFTGAQNAQAQTFTGQQNTQAQQAVAAQNAQAQAAAAALAAQGQQFTGQQNTQAQQFTGAQNTQAQDAATQNLLLSLANSNDIAGGNRLAAGLTAAGTGLGAGLSQWAAQQLRNL